MEIVAGAAKIRRHRRYEIAPMLATVGLTKLDPGDLGDRISNLRPRIGVSSRRLCGRDRAIERKVRALAGASWRRPPCHADRRPRQVCRSDRTASWDFTSSPRRSEAARFKAYP